MATRADAFSRATGLAGRGVLLACLAACAGSETPTTFLRGQNIPLERWILRVRSTDVLSPAVLANLEEFRGSDAAGRVLAIHVELEGSDPGASKSRTAQERAFLKLMWDCRLKDREGREYDIGLPIPNRHFRRMTSGGSLTMQDLEDSSASDSKSRLPRDWVLLFAVPEGRSGFSIHIRNRRPLEGQPRLVSVELGR